MACSPPTEEKEARSSQPRKTQPPKAVKENRYDPPSPQTRFAKLASFRNFSRAPIGFVPQLRPSSNWLRFRSFARAPVGFVPQLRPSPEHTSVLRRTRPLERGPARGTEPRAQPPNRPTPAARMLRAAGSEIPRSPASRARSAIRPTPRRRAASREAAHHEAPEATRARRCPLSTPRRRRAPPHAQRGGAALRAEVRKFGSAGGLSPTAARGRAAAA